MSFKTDISIVTPDIKTGELGENSTNIETKDEKLLSFDQFIQFEA